MTLSMVLALAGARAADTAYADAPETIRFLIFSDRTGGARAGIFEDAIDKIRLLRPEFIINVGDNVEGYSRDRTELRRQWDEFDQLVARLPGKFFRVAGNHDLGTPEMTELWKERYGRTYYHFLYKDALFLVLDTEDPRPAAPPADLLARHVELMRIKAKARTPAQRRDYALRFRDFVDAIEHYMTAEISEAQLSYFSGVLQQNQGVRWTFLFMHKPAWQQPYLSDRFLELEKLLASRPYSVFAGHRHEYHHEVRRNQHYVVMATTGGELIDPFSDQVFDHVMWVTLDADGPHFANIRTDALFDIRGRQPSLKEDVDQVKIRLGIPLPAPR